MSTRTGLRISEAGRSLRGSPCRARPSSKATRAPETAFSGAAPSHGLNVASPQPVANGSRYVFSGWSDGGAMNRTVTVEGPLNLTATFTLEHLVELWTSPAGRELVLDRAPAPAPPPH